MPSLRRSRNERCRLGPEPSGGKIDVIGFVRDDDDNDDDDDDKLFSMDSVVGLPDEAAAAAWFVTIVGLHEKCDSIVDNGDSLNGPISLPLLLPTLPVLGGGMVIFPIVRGLRLNDPGISINDRCFGEPSRDDDIFDKL